MAKILLFSLFFMASAGMLAGEEYIAVIPQDVPPYYVKKGNKTIGFGNELLHELAKKLNISIKFVTVPTRTDALNMIRSRKAQIIPNTYKSLTRSDIMLFTEGFDSCPAVLATRQDRYDINSPDDIVNHKLAYYANNAEVHELSLKNVRLIGENSARDMLMDLMSGRADAVIYPVTPLMAAAKESGIHERLKVIRPAMYETVRVMGISSDHPDLFLRLNSALVEYMKTGEFSALYKKWQQSSIPFWNVRNLSVYFTVLLIITISGLYLWRLTTLRTKNRELKKAKTELELSEAKFLLLAEATSDILIFSDRDLSEIYFVSSAYARVCGGDLAEFRNNPLSLRGRIHPDDLSVLQPDSLLIKESENVPRVRIINKDTKETRWGLIKNYSFSGKETGGAPMRAIVINDITDLTLAQIEKTAQDRIMAQQAKYASMGEMVRAISHQWRQPLNALNLCLQIIDEQLHSCKNDETGEYIKTAENLVEHMSQTIEDFSLFFKAGKSAELFDAPEAVIGIMRMIEPQIKSLGISFTIKCGCDVSCYIARNCVKEKDHQCRYRVSGIKNEFKHAVINLIQNAKDELAVKTSGEKEIKVDMGCNGGFRLSVSDSGRGIDPKLAEKIFHPDFTLKEGGTGLGLHMSKTILESMNGKIKVEKHSPGAKFTVSLPAYIASSSS